MSCEDRRTCNCIGEIIRKILLLQRRNCDDDGFIGCDKPFLGPIINNVCYNTRPVQLFNAYTSNPWTFSYTLADGTTGVSNILRVESADECCCTCRILATNETTGELTNTNNFCTIDLNSCGAIKCLNDTSVDLC